MPIQAVVRWFLPKEDHFYTFLENQAALCHAAALELAKFGTGPSVQSVREAVQSVEHQADNIVRQLEDALARTFVTPLDREDIHKLSSELDDVTDLTNLAARACNLYGVTQPTEPMTKLIGFLVKSSELLKNAVPHVRKHEYEKIIELCREIRTLEKEADLVFRAAISDLFQNNTIDAKELLRQKEVLEDIEHAVDHCDNVADLLSNLAVKHG